MVVRLIGAGAAVDAPDSEGHTPLMKAVQYGQVSLPSCSRLCQVDSRACVYGLWHTAEVWGQSFGIEALLKTGGVGGWRLCAGC